MVETRLEPFQSSGKANNPGVNLVLSWEANGTRVENRRGEAKQLVIQSISGHSPFLVGASWARTVLTKARGISE